MTQAICKTAAEELKELVARHTLLSEKGFAVRLCEEPASWCGAIRALGARQAYRLMGEELCALYEERFGREYLFSSACLRFEIAYHADAYFWSLGVRGFLRHPTTLLFSREELKRHCEVIDISTDDVLRRRQRLMFGYARGVRAQYRNTEADPFDRRALPGKIRDGWKRK